MYDADIVVSMFVDTGLKRMYPLWVVSPYILTVGVDVPSDPEMIILPDNVVLPFKVLFPIWVVEPDTSNEPVIVVVELRKTVVPSIVVDPLIPTLPLKIVFPTNVFELINQHLLHKKHL